MKYLIPSLGRSSKIGNIIDILGKENTVVYVNNNEVDEYAKYISIKNIKGMPDNIKGIVYVRKYMYEDNIKENYICQIDDDFGGMIYRHDGNDTFVTIKDKDHIYDIIGNAYQIAYDIGTPLFCFDGTHNPTFYSSMTMTKFSGTLPSFHGMIPSLMGDMNYDTRFTVMEDHDLAFMCKFKKRYIFFDHRYSMRFHTPYFQEGGCSTNRNTKILNDCGELLLKKYGSVCVKRDKNKLQYGINFPY